MYSQELLILEHQQEELITAQEEHQQPEQLLDIEVQLDQTQEQESDRQQRLELEELQEHHLLDLVSGRQDHHLQDQQDHLVDQDLLSSVQVQAADQALRVLLQAEAASEAQDHQDLLGEEDSLD